MSFDRESMKQKAAQLAASGVFIGTSSWKYEGWRGMLYDEARYVYRGKFAETRFERNCLAEYAEVFKTVCVDAAYYTFPRDSYLEGLAEQVPAEPLTVGQKIDRLDRCTRWSPNFGNMNDGGRVCVKLLET